MGGLLEREDELGELTEAVGAAAAGRGAVVLIAGEAGIGKTSVVRALRERLGEGVAFLRGGCEPLSVPVPLGPLRELYEAACGRDLLELGSDDRLVMARSVLDALAGQAPVVAVIEDAHWADPLTLDMVRMLTRRIEELAAVLVVTYRDDELEAHPELGLLLGDLATAPAIRRIALRPLSEAAVHELAGPQGLDASELLRVTGGNPFLVVESVAAAGRLPASIRDAALARVGRLGASAREAVDAAAVIGQRFDAELVAAIVPADPEALEEACARGVLLDDGDGLGFRHELIRDAIESSISPQRRRALHARVAMVLAQRPRVEGHARLAHHAELGGLAAEAARYATLAAEEAERAGALRETYMQAARALRLRGAVEDRQRFELLIRYARASNFANPRLEEGVEAAQQAVALADRLGDVPGRGRASMTLAYALWSLERVVEARRAAEEAVAAFDPAGDGASLAWAYATLIRIVATAFNPATAIELAPRALELADQAGLEEVRVDVAVSLGLARGHRGDGEALRILDDALAAARRGGFTIRTVRSYVNLTSVAVALRAHERVDRIAAEATPLLEELQVARLPILAIRFSHARSLMDRGRWEEALAVARLREGWWQGEYPVACAIDGLIAARRGEPEAAGLLRHAWTEISGMVSAESSRHGMIRVALVEAAWLGHDLAAALAELRAARDSPAVGWFARPGGELAVWGSRLGVTLDAPPGAPEPVLLELEGDWRRAIETWRDLKAPYEAALAALPGDDRAARDALAALHRLGASAAVRAFARHRAAAGARPPRGPRRSTLAHPAGLTLREQEVLEGMATGASNAMLAAMLHLSERTVGHHVSAILRKLDAPSRGAAVERARAQGLLAQDRETAV